jgi:mRNA-degrading endonuclease toxin of MazEF toxin-antitoxin module
MTVSYLPRDVVYVDLGTSIGHELNKKRPCVILKTFEVIKMALVIPMSHGKPGVLFTNVELMSNDDKKSFAQCHQLRSISYDRIQKKFNKLSESDFNKIRNVISDFLDS